MTSFAPRADAAVKRLAWLVAGFALLRTLLASAIPIFDDEAYYWVWSRHLAWGFLDHPPGIGAIVRASTWLFGDSALAIRLPSILLAAGTAFAVYGLTRDLGGDEDEAFSAAVILHALPVVATASFFTAPDAPMLFLWVLTARAVWRAINGRPWYWIAAGAAFGLGLLFKHSMGLFIPGLAALVLVRHRHVLRDPRLFAGIAVAAVIFWPNLKWNVDHDWATVRYVYGRALWMQPIHPAANTAALLAAVLLYLSPILGVLLAVAPAAIRRRPSGLFLLAIALPTIVAVLQAASGGRGKPHYILPAALTAVPALALWRGPRVAAWTRSGLALGFAMTTIALAIVSVGTLFSPGLIHEVVGWQEASDRIATLVPDPRSAVIVTGSYQTAGQIAYATHDRYVVLSRTKESAFGAWAPPERHAGRDALIVYDRKFPGFAGPIGERLCDRHETLAPLVVQAGGRPMRTFEFVRCRGLRARALFD